MTLRTSLVLIHLHFHYSFITCIATEPTVSRFWKILIYTLRRWSTKIIHMVKLWTLTTNLTVFPWKVTVFFTVITLITFQFCEPYIFPNILTSHESFFSFFFFRCTLPLFKNILITFLCVCLSVWFLNVVQGRPSKFFVIYNSYSIVPKFKNGWKNIYTLYVIYMKE